MNNSCINISVDRVGHPLFIFAKRANATTSLKASKKNESLRFNATRFENPLTCAAHRTTPRMNLSLSLVCSVGFDLDGREVFLVRDGVFLLADGETFRVIKENA